MALSLGCTKRLGCPPAPAQRNRAKCIRPVAVLADHTARVRGDAARVHFWLSNLQYWPTWYPGTKKAVKLGVGDALVRPGTKFELYQEMWNLKLPMQYEVLECEPGKKLVLSGISEYHTQMDQFVFMTDRHDLKHTCVRYLADMRLREWRSALQPVLGKFLAKGPEEAMIQLQKTLNSPQSPLLSSSFEGRFQQYAREARLSQKGHTSSSRGGTTTKRAGRQPHERGGPGNSAFNLRGLFSWSSASSMEEASPISSYQTMDTGDLGLSQDPMGYYSLLGLSTQTLVSLEEIKVAYRKLAMELHPDRQMGKDQRTQLAAAEKYAKLLKAYETLKDPDTRRLYDSGELVEATLSF